MYRLVLIWIRLERSVHWTSSIWFTCIGCSVIVSVLQTSVLQTSRVEIFFVYRNNKTKIIYILIHVNKLRNLFQNLENDGHILGANTSSTVTRGESSPLTFLIIQSSSMSWYIGHQWIDTLVVNELIHWSSVSWYIGRQWVDTLEWTQGGSIRVGQAINLEDSYQTGQYFISIESFLNQEPGGNNVQSKNPFYTFDYFYYNLLFGTLNDINSYQFWFFWLTFDSLVDLNQKFSFKKLSLFRTKKRTSVTRGIKWMHDLIFSHDWVLVILSVPGGVFFCMIFFCMTFFWMIFSAWFWLRNVVRCESFTSRRTRLFH